MVRSSNYKIATVGLDGPALCTIQFTFNEIQRLRASLCHAIVLLLLYCEIFNFANELSSVFNQSNVFRHKNATFLKAFTNLSQTHPQGHFCMFLPYFIIELYPSFFTVDDYFSLKKKIHSKKNSMLR